MNNRLFAVAVAAQMTDGTTKAFQFVQASTSAEAAEAVSLEQLNAHSLAVDGGDIGVSYRVLHYSVIEIPREFLAAFLIRSADKA